MKKSLRFGFGAAVPSLALSSPAWAVIELDTGGSFGANGWTITPCDASAPSPKALPLRPLPTREHGAPSQHN